MPWPVDEKYIVDCEAKLGAILPEAYRSAMIAENGGTITCSHETWQLHPIWDKSEKKRLKRTANDVARETEVMQTWAGWPVSAVCIAGNGTGDALVFLASGGKCEPAVYQWDHETGHVRKLFDEFPGILLNDETLGAIHGKR